MDKDEMDMPALVSDSDNDDIECDDLEDDCDWDDIDDDDEEEMNMLSGDVTCLFCTKIETSVDAVISHCKVDHHFDLPALCQRWSVDCISYIKMINFCRKEHPSPDKVTQGLISDGAEWQGDDYMQACDPSDLMLQFDIESVIESLSTSSVNDGSSDSVQDCYLHKQPSEAVTALATRAKTAERQCELLKDELGRVLQDMEKLRISGQQLVMNLSGDVKESSSNKSPKTENLNDEDGYFASYSHHGIHMTMLKDTVRTESYRDFMLCNRHLFEGKTVLDVGCGTGILSMFAAKAGAKQVVAVDSSQIIYQAMDIARENNMHEKITFVKGKVEDVTLPVEKFDVIISEWMGYFLLFEAMLDSVLWARDNYLSPGGCVYPDFFEMKVVGVSDPEFYQSTYGYWDNVYGFKMSCMKSPMKEEVQVCTVSGDKVVTEPAVIKELDVPLCKVGDLDFHCKFSLVCLQDAKLTAIVGYFDTYFNHGCEKKIFFSTGPKSTRTHWEQAVMILPKPLTVNKGSIVPCQMTYRKHPHDSRGVIINLTVGGLKHRYSLS